MLWCVDMFIPVLYKATSYYAHNIIKDPKAKSCTWKFVGQVPIQSVVTMSLSNVQLGIIIVFTKL